MDFTPTSVDGVDLKQSKDEQTNEHGTNEQGLRNDEKQTQNDEVKIEGLVDDKESPILDLNAASEAPVAKAPAVEEPVIPQEEAKPDLGFETTTIDLEQPKVEQEVVVDTQPNKDLLSFLDEHNEMISEFQRLNVNYDDLNDAKIIETHLKAQYPQLDQSDIDILLGDYDYDEEGGDKADIVRKKIAIQKAVGEAKNYLTTRKDILSKELGSRNLGGPTAAEKAAQALGQQAFEAFTTETKAFFNPEKFEGFNFKVGDKKALKVKVNNVEAVANTQSDINNVIGKFFNTETGSITDAAGYHKAMFAANNADTLAQHFYQQGRADALSEEAKASKNINMDGRQTHVAPTAKTTWKLVD